MAVNIRVNADATLRAMKRIARDQSPFAVAHALTQLAKGAQQAVQRRTRRVFDIRAEFVPRGVRMKPARKSTVRGSGVGTSAVYTAPGISGFMPIHEEGGTRTPNPGGSSRDRGRSIAIPAGGLTQRPFRTTTGKVRKRWKPGTLLQRYNAKGSTGQSTTARTRGGRRDPFIIRSTSSGVPMIVRRKGRRSRPLEVLYTFHPSVRIDKRWEFEETVHRNVRGNYRRQFERSYKMAIRTAR